MRAYELEVSTSLSRRAARSQPLWDDYAYDSSPAERRSTLILLFQYLGAYHLAEDLRHGSQGMLYMPSNGLDRFMSRW